MDQTANDTALALVQMATTPPRASIRAERSSRGDCVLLEESQTTSPYTTPSRHFKLAKVKRTHDDLLTVVYSTGGETMEIPFARGEAPDVFYSRREKAARLLFDDTRKDAYCMWRNCVVNIVVEDPRWVLFKNSLQQKRYACGSVQLTVCRYTCAQWKDCDFVCRNCQHRNWRVGCLSPKYLYHIMPLCSSNELAEMEKDMSVFEPLSVDKDATVWSNRVPSLMCR
tara:strand:- start:175 stop:852 length:678 start_codon:yes stop_codon:yes gene_type:complete